MKKVQLKSIDVRKNAYIIRLGNGTVHEFASKRQAKAFLNKTSMFLTQCLYEANELYRQTWNAYQGLWFLFSTKKGENMLRLEAECQSSINIIDKLRTLITQKADNYTAFHDFSMIFMELKKVVKILLHIQKRRSNTPEIYNLHSLYRNVMRLEKMVSQYREEDADFLIDIKKTVPYTSAFSLNGMAKYLKSEEHESLC